MTTCHDERSVHIWQFFPVNYLYTVWICNQCYTSPLSLVTSGFLGLQTTGSTRDAVVVYLSQAIALALFSLYSVLVFLSIFLISVSPSSVSWDVEYFWCVCKQCILRILLFFRSYFYIHSNGLNKYIFFFLFAASPFSSDKDATLSHRLRILLTMTPLLLFQGEEKNVDDRQPDGVRE